MKYLVVIVFLTSIGCRNKQAGHDVLEKNEEEKNNVSIAIGDTQKEQRPEKIGQLIKLGMHKADLEKKFGEPDRYAGSDAVYENWDPRIPINASKKGLSGIYITYDERNTVESWIFSYQ